ncbi:uncharacterized protein LOC121430554 [Lytechinus variegatus]|uniref:uncharacterized protein LOC121430554 n=1 Tax=Lytechinus variegatus TaxID=7654 RepID=UPI001BB1A2D8|nr:uncharacterized protein LOC121430554 [Lytechinus variegatus]
MADKQVKVALWGVPRTMSTVFAKCMSAIEEMEVYLELYSYSKTASGMFESATGRELPRKLDGNEAVYAEALEVFKSETNGILVPRRISCCDIKRDLETTTSKFVFVKEMAFTDYILEYLPNGFKYVFLIREPAKVYKSFRIGVKEMFYFNKDDRPIDIIHDDTSNLRPMTWYEQQHRLWKYVQQNLDPNPIIIDATDLATNPREILKGFCDAVGFPYSDSLLQWSPSHEFPKNFVTAGENLFDSFSAMYSTAFNSTHFMAPTVKGPLPRDLLTDDVIKCVDYSVPFYREMYEARMQLP